MGAEADRRESARALMSGVANQSMESLGIAHIDEACKGERAGASEWSQRDTLRHRRSKAEVADRVRGSASQLIWIADSHYDEEDHAAACRGIVRRGGAAC
jgi:hypothetical protein